MVTTTRLAVLGSPIAHSKSPRLHAAAYAVLGLDWRYEALDVREDELARVLAALGTEWRGLSLTMPLKRAVLDLVAVRDPIVDRLGLANTVVLGRQPKLFNTDVAAIRTVLEDVSTVSRVVVIGGGATAASALEAVRERGAAARVVVARDPQKAAVALGELATEVVGFAAGETRLASADVVVSTLPGTAPAPPMPPRVPGTPLLDVAYDPWPTATGAAWTAAGGRLLHGLDMLIEQAMGQIRVFLSGHPNEALPHEAAVRSAMRAAVGR